MLSSFGKNIQVNIYGGSHEPEIGVIIKGLPLGTPFDMKALQQFMDRRAPGSSPFTTPRKESDTILPKSGIYIKGSTAMVADSSIKLVIKNTNTRSQDYKALRDIPRPGHADYTAFVKYGDKLNMAGGGPFSARMTAGLCIAGGIALQVLQELNIEVGAHIYSIGNILDAPLNTLDPAVPQSDFPVISPEAGDQMKALILQTKAEGDSIGGIVEVFAKNVPAGIGGPMYDGVEGALAPIFFGIPAVKGIEFGAGFTASGMRGSENNDPFRIKNGTVITTSNNHGGILGGITSGMPIIARLAFKPTPSITKEQNSISLSNMTNETLSIQGRHDPCVAVRAVPVCEAAMAIGLLDMLLEENE